MSALEKYLSVKINKVLVKQSNAAAKAYKKDGFISVSVLERHRRQMRQHLKRYYKASASTVGEEMFVGVVKKKSFSAAMINWINYRANTTVSTINAATWATITNSLAHSTEEGLTLAETAKRLIASTGGDIARRRANKIARTEIHAASNTASHITAKEIDVPLMKMWTSAQSDRTRPSHAAADGQTVAMDENFIVGGASLQHPGDMNAPIDETINCRCVCLYSQL